MTILSVSLDEKTIEKIRKLMVKTGQKSRSKIFSNAIDYFEKQNETFDGLNGTTTCIISLVWKKKKMPIDNHSHNFSKQIKLDAHFDTQNGCSQVIVIEANANKIKNYYHILSKNKQILKLSLMIA